MNRRGRTLLLAAGAIALLAGLAVPWPRGEPCETWPVVAVVDGDSFTVELPGLPAALARRGVRLAGIDAPELRGKCEGEKAAARAARDALAALLAAGEPRICPLGWEKYGRVLATVTVEGADGGPVDVAAALIAQGHARPYDGGTRQGWCD